MAKLNGELYVGETGKKLKELGGGSPIGAIEMFSGSTAPEGYLFCQGQAVSRTTYAELFAAIGTTYGTGDGSTTFNLPNLKGRVAVGQDTSDTNFDVLGETGGTKTHSHGFASGNAWANIGSPNYNANALGFSATNWHGTKSTYSVGDASSSQASGHPNRSHDTSLGGSTDGATTLQPYLVLNYIIKAYNAASSAPATSQVKNSYSESVTDVYACNYVNNLHKDSGWQNCTKSASALTTRYFVARKINDQVFVDAQFTNPNSTAIPKGTIIGTVPSGFAPTHEIWVTCRPIGAEGSVGFVYFSTNGNITYYGSSTINTGLNFNAVFLIN